MITPKAIILAAGAASRLPNKTLLPTRDMVPIISTLITHFEHNGIKEITVVITPGSILREYLNIEHPSVMIAYQEQLHGTVDAIRCGWMGTDIPVKAPVFVACADNLFPYGEGLPIVTENTAPMAQVREITWRELCKDLDGYQEGAWIHRMYRYAENHLCLAGWLFLNTMPSECSASFIDLLNEVDANAVAFTGEGWWDLGTTQAYRSYWSAL
jgi:hypothetical protein